MEMKHGSALPIHPDDIEEVRQKLITHDVVDGPPELRDVVATLWPELLHKVKPPLSEMH
jgi:hypothetical protein